MLSKLFEEVVFYISEFFRQKRRVGRSPPRKQASINWARKTFLVENRRTPSFLLMRDDEERFFEMKREVQCSFRNILLPSS